MKQKYISQFLQHLLFLQSIIKSAFILGRIQNSYYEFTRISGKGNIEQFWC